jgi:hypothetical protein
MTIVLVSLILAVAVLGSAFLLAMSNNEGCLPWETPNENLPRTIDEPQTVCR